MSETVLVVAAHPDDETIGCGGTLMRHKARGDEIHWLIVSNIDSDFGWPAERVATRQREIERVAGMYGFGETIKLDFPAARLDTIPVGELVGAINAAFNQLKPNTVYLPYRDDIHTDHEVCFRATVSCCKDFRNPFVHRVLMYETLSETDYASLVSPHPFQPNLYVDITDHLERKLEIFGVYESEVMAPPYPRSFELVRALAKVRGSRISRTYGEAFVLLEEKWL